jgi:hypothetical protein
VGNAFVDDADAAAVTTFFFITDGKSIVPVPLVIRANVERLAYSSIYVFKHPSSSAERDFVDGVLNMRGFVEGDDGGTDNDATP